MPSISEEKLPYLALMATVLAEAPQPEARLKIRGISDDALIAFSNNLQGPIPQNYIHKLLSQTGIRFEDFLAATGSEVFRLPKEREKDQMQVLLLAKEPEKALSYISDVSQSLGFQLRLPAQSGTKKWKEAEGKLEDLIVAAYEKTLEVTPSSRDFGEGKDDSLASRVRQSRNRTSSRDLY